MDHLKKITELVVDFAKSHRRLSTFTATSLLGFALLRWYCRGGRCRERSNLSGKIIVITGGHSGIGLETSRILAGMGTPTVILACRNPLGIKDKVEYLQQSSKNPNIRAMQLDLSDLESIREFSQEFKRHYDHIDMLIANAGVLAFERRETKQGFEMDYGTNHLGHMYLVYQLIDAIRAAKSETRIVILSSLAHKGAKMHWDDLDWKTRTYEPSVAYSESKLANVLFTIELNRRLGANEKSAHITANAVHPGLIDTAIAREANDMTKWANWAILFFIGKTPEQGAQTTVWACISTVLCGRGGLYLADCNIAPTGPAATQENASRLWKVSCQQLNIPEDW